MNTTLLSFNNVLKKLRYEVEVAVNGSGANYQKQINDHNHTQNHLNKAVRDLDN